MTPHRVRAALLAALLLAPAAAGAQAFVTDTAGAHYRAGGLKTWLLGRDWRALWTTPIRVEVLDLGSYAGGLVPTEKGGGNQTLGLRFRGADGREYAFRSVDKYPGRSDPDIEGTLVQKLLKDQVSSLVPAAPVAAFHLQEAAGLLHYRPRIFVLPDDPRLGEFRAEFAGMLGTLEERPDVGQTGDPVLARAAALEDTDDFFPAFRAGAAHRLDVRDLLRSRLFDILLNDWDRHADQYKWARFDEGGGHRWRVVATDRDYAFASYDGALVRLAGMAIPNALAFRPAYGGSLKGLILNSQEIDRYFLPELPRAAWDSVALDLRARLSDDAIRAAFARLPAEFAPVEGERIASILRARRDLLPEVAADFHALIAREAEINGKDSPDFVSVERLPDGMVEVSLAGTESGPAYYRRRFDPAETREVRVFLHGGNDRARVFGPGPERLIVRLIGGEGDDELRDETATGRRTAFYDDEGENRFAPRRGTKVDEREWDEPAFARGGGRTPRRDWGLSKSMLSPAFDWRRAGPVVGVGPERTRYGFRRFPYASSQELKALWAPLHSRFAVEYDADFRYVGSNDRLEIEAQASELEQTRFHGFGNQSPRLSGEQVRLWERQVMVEPSFWWGLAEKSFVWVGGTARWSDPQPELGTVADLLRPDGTRSFGLAGARAGVDLDGRDSTSYPRGGYTFRLSGGAYPLVTGDAESFFDARAVGTAYLSLGAGPTLALRAGGERVWGDFPVQYAAFLGGQRSVRGHSSQRFAGDMAAYGSAELRQIVTRANLVVKGDLGVFALADAGRVWYDGESDGGWHTAVGGGVFFSVLGRSRTLAVSYAQGEKGVVYFTFGVPF